MINHSTLNVQELFIEAVQLHIKGRINEAFLLYEDILKKDPKHILALRNQGITLSNLGRPEDALLYYDRALAIDPKDANTYSNRGAIFRALDRPDEALESCRRALVLDPKHFNALFNLGLALRALGHPEDALKSYDRALALDPKHVNTLSNRGNTLKDLNRPEEALESYDRALKLDPKHVGALSNRGITLTGLDRFEEALESYNRALKLNPKHVDVLFNRGNTLTCLDRFQEALDSYDRALVLAPKHAEAFSNQGAALSKLDRPEEALKSFDKALVLDSKHVDTNFNKSQILLLTGNFSEGWRGYNWRKEKKEFSLLKKMNPKTIWDGGNIKGKIIYVYPEQGLGDIIQFIRYAKLLKKSGATVIFSAPDNLYNLLSNYKEIDTLLKIGDTPSAFDCHAAIMDLPKLFNTTLDNIPSYKSYFQASDDLTSKWSERLGRGNTLRLGIVYAGNPQHKNDRNRSIDPKLLKPLTRMKGVSVYSLQVGRNETEADVFGGAVVSLGDELTDYEDTAAVIGQLDMVLTVDTSVAHLAGALGVPVWTLLPKNPDWRWLLDRDDSPWYPSMTLFRQKERGSWPEVIERIESELETLVKDKVIENQIQAAVLCDKKAY